MTPRSVRIRARAKINLTLEIRGKRDDGYHEVASVMALIDLADDVRVAPSPRLDVRIRPDVGAVAGDDLATRAVRTLAAAAKRDPLAHVLVRKRIPVAAGLGGGSSDAAAVMRGLALLWEVRGLDVTGLGASIGSDVPYFASGATAAIVSGRGERVDALPPPPATWIALVTLPVRCPTAAVYAALDGSRRSDGSRSRELAEALRRGTATPARMRALACNDLDRAAEQVCPAIAEARTAAHARGIELSLSGSGPSLFAVADDRAHAIRLARSLRRAGLRSRPRVVSDVDPLPA